MTRQVVIAGASGFLGGHLAASLQSRGHRVIALVRRPAENPAESQWDPYTAELDQAVIDAADVVIGLSGSPLLGNPHSTKWQRELRRSRVVPTTVLARAIARSESRPGFLVGNGVSWYGDQPTPEVDERTPSRGEALMTSVCREWQEAAAPAQDAGSRVCFLRTAPVMDRDGQAMRVLRPLFRAWLGARLGSGEQRMPMISRRDWVDAATLLAEGDFSGPFNLACPQTPTNAEFTATLACRLGRRAPLAVPAPVLKIAFGPIWPELLGSLAPRPATLLDAGYSFSDPDVAAVLAAGLSE